MAEVGVIVLPILFSEEDRLGGDERFAEALNGNFVVVAQTGSHQTTQHGYPSGVAKIGTPLEFLFDWPGIVGPILEVGSNAACLGTPSVSPELDGLVRSVHLLMLLWSDYLPTICCAYL